MEDVAELPAKGDLVVLGGGLLGSAVANAGAALGYRVTVASPTARAHAGLWRAWNADQPLPRLRGADLVVALSRLPAARPEGWSRTLTRVAQEARTAGARAVVVCGPAGRGAPDLDAFDAAVPDLSAVAAVARFGVLAGVGDRCVWPLIQALRTSGVARVPRGLPASRALLVPDAARAVLRLLGRREVRTLIGPEALRLEDIADRMVARFGGRHTAPWWGGNQHAGHLRAWENLPDDWEDGVFGPRGTLPGWIAGLPGLRRKR